MQFVVKVQQLDQRLSAQLHLPGAVASAVAKTLELTGHGVPWFAVTLGMLLWRPSALWLNLAVGLVLDLVLVGVLKVLVRRPRPIYNRDDMLVTVSVDRFSFPSGHSTRAAYGALFIAAASPGLDFRWPFLWALSTGLSRVTLGRHHVSDVIAGLLLGALLFAVHSKGLMVGGGVYSPVSYDHVFGRAVVT